MVCGILLVSILYTALNSNSVLTSLQEKIKEVISGQEQVSKVKTNLKNNVFPPLDSSLSEDPLLPTDDLLQTHSLQSSSEAISQKGFWSQLKNGWNSFTKKTWNNTKDIASKLWEGSKQIASNVWNWTKENKEYIAGGSVVTLGIGSLFVSLPVGVGILISAGIGGVISWLTGNDPKTIAKDTAIGGFAGIISMGVGGAITSGFRAGATGLLSKLSPFFQKYLPLSLGGGAAGATDSAIWDKLKNGAISWKNALLSAAFGLGLVFGVGHLVEKAPAIVSKINQLPVTPITVFSDGSISAPKSIGDTGFGQWLQKFVSNGNESKPTATEKIVDSSKKTRVNNNYNKINHPKKPPGLHEGDSNYSFNIQKGNNDKFRIITSDGRIIETNKLKPNVTAEKTTAQGNTYTVKYNEKGLPDFDPYAKKSLDGKIIEIELPKDAIVGSSSDQTRFATILLKEKYSNWKTELGFTPDQIAAINSNKGNIGKSTTRSMKIEEKLAIQKKQLTWHHDEETGKLILVPYDLNANFPHIGGHKFWGQQKR